MALASLQSIPIASPPRSTTAQYPVATAISEIRSSQNLTASRWKDISVRAESSPRLSQTHLKPRERKGETILSTCFGRRCSKTYLSLKWQVVKHIASILFQRPEVTLIARPTRREIPSDGSWTS